MIKLRDKRSAKDPNPELEREEAILKEVSDLPLKVYVASMCNPKEPGSWIKKYGHTLKYLEEYSSDHFNTKEAELLIKRLLWSPN